MNLVIDDAVEVSLATKTETEKRRSLGESRGYLDLGSGLTGMEVKYCSKGTMFRSYKLYNNAVEQRGYAWVCNTGHL